MAIIPSAAKMVYVKFLVLALFSQVLLHAPVTNALAVAPVIPRALQQAMLSQQQASLAARRAGPNRRLLQSCVTDNCGAQLAACMGDLVCLQYLQCNAVCFGPTGTNFNLTCLNACGYQFFQSSTVASLNQCIQANDCNGPSVPCDCPPPNPATDPKVFEIPLKKLCGTYDIIYGLSQEFDCFPYQQYHFPPHNDTKPPRNAPKQLNFTGDYIVQLSEGGPLVTIPIKFAARDPVTGAYVTQYSVSGISASDTWYVLDSTPNREFVLVVYCADIGVACLPGGFVLADRKMGKSFKLPPSIAQRFEQRLISSGWAELHNAQWSNWCSVPVIP